MEKGKRNDSYTSPKPNISPGNNFKRNRGMQPVVKPKNFKETLMRLWKYFGEERKLLIVIFTLVIISSAFGLLVPYLIGKAVDTLNLGELYVDFKNLKIIAVVLIFTYITDSIITLSQGFIMAGISQRIVFRLRETLFEKLQKLPLMFFDTHTHGEIMSRLSNDIENVSTTISQSTIQLMASFINIIGAFTMMLILSPLLTVASMVTLPLVLFMTNSIAKRTKVLFKEQQVVLGRLNGHIEESISGIHVVKAFNREDKIIEEFDELNSNLCEVGIKAQVWSGYIMPLMNVINNIGFASVAAIGGVLAAKDLITVGIIASFISYSRQFARPLNDLASIFNTFQSAVAGAERVFETLDEKEELKDIKEAQVLSNVRGEVEFNNVTFGYKEGSYVLKNISFNVKRGENVALVGPTGAGKTTIVNLLTGFYDVLKGEILIDGKSIKKYTKDSLRKSFGIVLQDSYLFSGTIRENIRYGNLNATDEEVESAAKMTNADAFITKLPKGYNTIISEGGVSLSQGEKQLVSIARAILANPAILVLDEATSSVDTRTELKIQQALLEVTKDRTSFIIAHRLSTIKDADKIMVIDNGSIMEMGTHEELIRKKEYYYKLYESQFN